MWAGRLLDVKGKEMLDMHLLEMLQCFGCQ